MNRLRARHRHPHRVRGRLGRARDGREGHAAAGRLGRPAGGKCWGGHAVEVLAEEWDGLPGLRVRSRAASPVSRSSATNINGAARCLILDDCFFGARVLFEGAGKVMTLFLLS